MHEKLKEVTHNMEGCWLGKGGVEDEIESTFSAKVEQERACHRRSALRESIVSVWRLTSTSPCECARVDRLRLTSLKCLMCRGTG